MNKNERMMMLNAIMIMKSTTSLLTNLLQVEEEKWTKEK